MNKKEYRIKNDTLKLEGAYMHNLKNIDVDIPKNKLIVITGVSGSGKTSLALDTIYAEGHRRYVESLTSYARLFLGRLEKPKIKSISGLAPCISVSQKVATAGIRSTVGTITEINDYLRILFSKIGKIYSPISGNLVKKETTSDVLNYVESLNLDKERIIIAYPLNQERSYTCHEHLALVMQKGYRRFYYQNKIYKIEDTISSEYNFDLNEIYIIVDNIEINSQDYKNRILSSCKIAFKESPGYCIVINNNQTKCFSDKLELDGLEFQELSPLLFNFNSPYGACKNCEGFGKTIDISLDLVIPDKNLSIAQGAVAIWRSTSMNKYLKDFISKSNKYKFSLNTPYKDLSEQDKSLLFNGNEDIIGIKQFFSILESRKDKIQYRVLLSRYKEKVTCKECLGTRLRKEALYVKINNLNIGDLLGMTIIELKEFFNNIELKSQVDKKIATSVIAEISKIIDYLLDLGLPYLSLNRESSTLSGGEMQRLKLANTLSNPLVGAIYVLDEPSIGLHACDINRLIKILKKLRDIGNTVIVVEHEEIIIKEADYIIDIGPQAGIFGGNLVFSGPYDKLMYAKNSLTAQYLSGDKTVIINKNEPKFDDFINLGPVTKYNICNQTVKIPLNAFTVVSGLSGSGKTTLIKELLYKEVKNYLDLGATQNLSGSYKRINNIELIDQSSILKLSRSNPSTYTKVYDDIRKLFALQPQAKAGNLNASSFSFNTEGGRCPKCKGEGKIKIEMQFMPDVYLDCDECDSKRFINKVLEVKYNNKNIADVLDMTVDEAYEYFNGHIAIINKLQCLKNVGLGYIKLGQESSNISGGESQRLKLAYHLTKVDNTKHTLFIFDEPTIGLHFDDVKKLLISIYSLIEKNNTVIIIEHDLDLIRNADWIIDLGPNGGKDGGQILYQGRLNKFLQQNIQSHTLTALIDKIKKETLL
ncbi:MAG: excinuclease ABC subunit UvrA [Solitalea-like symbiont of Acarus siro]